MDKNKICLWTKLSSYERFKTYIHFLRKFLFIILSFLNLVMESNCFQLGPPRFLITEGIHFVLYKISTLLSEKKVVVIIYSYIY